MSFKLIVMEIKERFLEILSRNRISQQEMAERIGVDASTISYFCKGKRKPGFDILERIAVAFPNVDLNWLITGNGSELNISDNSTNALQISNSHESLNGQLKFDFSTEKAKKHKFFYSRFLPYSPIFPFTKIPCVHQYL